MPGRLWSRFHLGLRSGALVGEKYVASSLVIEQMRAADLDAVVEVERLASPSPWSAGLFLHELQLEFSRLVVARAGVVVLGYACWWEIGGEVHLLNIAVHPDHRRRGIGAALLRHLLDRGAAGGATVAGLEVRAGNRAALALYERMGFYVVGHRRDYYGPGQHAVLMDCRLLMVGDDERGFGVA